MRQLDGKNVFLTGASRGMGREIARGLAKEGASIALVARTESNLKELAEELAGLGGRAIAIPTDVSDKAQIKEAVRRARDEFGEIHILINSAGVLDNEPIPLGQRQTIRRYFESIRPDQSETDQVETAAKK
jgi:3-oxoacyl-[acyl-carrier protein] reductase